DGNVKLLDFGIAKLIHRDADRQITASDSRPMTIDYAAPEQIRGGETTTQTDVYQLGIVLFELLTSTRPFHRGKDFYELVHEICEVGVPRPSRVADRRALRGDLDAIVLRATARDPGERYGSMEAFAADLAAFLDGRPVTARRTSLLYRQRKFLTRHPLSSTAVGVFFALLTAFAATAGMQAEALRERAEQTRQTVAFLESVFTSVDLQGESGDGVLVHDLLRETKQRLYADVVPPSVRARFMLALAGVYSSLETPNEQIALAREALDLARDAYPAGGFEVAESMRVLGNGLLALQQHDEALAYFEQGIDQLRRLHSEPIHIARLESRIGYALQQKGDLNQASVFFNRALNRAREAGATESPIYGGMANGYAALLIRRADFPGALEANAEAMRNLQGHFGPTSAWLNTIRQQRADILTNLARYDEAILVLREVLAGQHTRLGKSHARIASVKTDLAKALSAVGEYQEAVSLLEDAIIIRSRVYGERARRTNDTRFNLGDTQIAMGDLAAAASTFREAVAVDRETVEPGHFFLGMSITRLATVLHQLGESPEAKTLFEQALDVLPEDLPFRSTTLLGYGKLLRDQGETSLARTYLPQALRIREGLLPPGHKLRTEVEQALQSLPPVARKSPSITGLR
ncbi:MAG: tetratricopeptide repeat-containing protein kinase family protein, partial [Pseudomonadota bacterium]